MPDDQTPIDEKLLGRALQALVAQLPFDVWVRDAADTMIFANDALLRRWGPGVLGRTVGTSEIVPDAAETWRTVNARVLAGETVKDEVVYELDGGQRTFVGVVTPVRDESGICGTVGINLDITGERRARAEAHRLGQVLRGVFTNAPVAIGVRAVRGSDIVHIENNPRAAAVHGSTPDGTRGKTESELGIPPEETRKKIERFRKARETHGPVPVQGSYRDEAGAIRLFDGMAVAIEDPDDECYAFVAEDVTELRTLQTGLIRADRLASLGTLSASIGHEIGTSAAVALGQVEIAMKRVERDEGRDAVLDGLREAQRALLRAVGVLRDMRALAVGATLGSETSLVDAAIDSVKEVLSRELRSVTLHETRLDGADVTMSHSRLVQTLLNLFRNALESGSTTLWIAVTRPTPEHVRIEIADDGPGVSAEVRGRLFEPFHSTKEDGTGLGLYVCRLLASLSGGTIEAHDRPGGGVRMVLEVPSP